MTDLRYHTKEKLINTVQPLLNGQLSKSQYRGSTVGPTLTSNHWRVLKLEIYLSSVVTSVFFVYIILKARVYAEKSSYSWDSAVF